MEGYAKWLRSLFWFSKRRNGHVSYQFNYFNILLLYRCEWKRNLNICYRKCQNMCNIYFLHCMNFTFFQGHRKRTFEQDSGKAFVLKKAKLDSKINNAISEDSPCAMKRKVCLNFIFRKIKPKICLIHQ